MSVDKEVIALYVATKGYIDDVPVHYVTRFEHEFLAFMNANHPEIGEDIRKAKKITDTNEAALKEAINTFKDMFATTEAKG